MAIRPAQFLLVVVSERKPQQRSHHNCHRLRCIPREIIFHDVPRFWKCYTPKVSEKIYKAETTNNWLQTAQVNHEMGMNTEMIYVGYMYRYMQNIHSKFFIVMKKWWYFCLVIPFRTKNMNFHSEPRTTKWWPSNSSPIFWYLCDDDQNLTDIDIPRPRASPATALAKRVFPVPGGPTNLGFFGDCLDSWVNTFWVKISEGTYWFLTQKKRIRWTTHPVGPKSDFIDIDEIIIE